MKKATLNIFIFTGSNSEVFYNLELKGKGNKKEKFFNAFKEDRIITAVSEKVKKEIKFRVDRVERSTPYIFSLEGKTDDNKLLKGSIEFHEK